MFDYLGLSWSEEACNEFVASLFGSTMTGALHKLQASSREQSHAKQ